MARRALLVATLSLTLAACLRPPAAAPGTPTTPAEPSPPGATASPVRSTPPLASGPDPAAGRAVLVGAGDIASCGAEGDEATARLLDGIEGTVFTLGDNVYPDGTADQFRACYDPTWGRHRSRTLPVPGNHDYATDDARGYLDYFGDAARPEGSTWYAVDVGAWRVIVLDSNCPEIEGGCAADGAQVRWLRDELRLNPRPCTIALWHHPRFSSGKHGDDDRTASFWTALEAAGAEIVLAGHDHDYERFAPQDASGRADAARGIRQFIVGTGGIGLRRIGPPRPNSEVRDDGTHGVLRLTLEPGRYAWAFLPVGGGPPRDEGAGACH